MPRPEAPLSPPATLANHSGAEYAKKHSYPASPRLRRQFPGPDGDNWLLTPFSGFVDLPFPRLLALARTACVCLASPRGRRTGPLADVCRILFENANGL